MVPLNTTLSQRTLDNVANNSLNWAFRRLAIATATRVNREAIRVRTPEARLAGRLFDYDDVLSRFLNAFDAGEFYESCHSAWRWNSRFWEQYALYYLSRYRVENDPDLLDRAIQHARHAITIESHAFSLTTLANILLAQMPISPTPGIVYTEAFQLLDQAIELESSRGWPGAQAYLVLFKGSVDLIRLGGTPTSKEVVSIRYRMDVALDRFSRDVEMQTTISDLRSEIY